MLALLDYDNIKAEKKKNEVKNMKYNVKLSLYGNGNHQIKTYNRVYTRGYRKENKRNENIEYDIETAKNMAEHSAKVSRNRAINQFFDYVRCNQWDYFVTITINRNSCDAYDYKKVSKKLSNALDYMRKRTINMKYLIIAEKHDNGAFHFHGLMANIEPIVVETDLYDRKGRKIYNLKTRIGFTTLTKIEYNEIIDESNLRAAFYASKYTSKCLSNIDIDGNHRHYWSSRNLNKPKVFHKYISQDILRTKRKFIYEQTAHKHTYLKTGMGDYEIRVNIFDYYNYFWNISKYYIPTTYKGDLDYWEYYTYIEYLEYIEFDEIGYKIEKLTKNIDWDEYWKFREFEDIQFELDYSPIQINSEEYYEFTDFSEYQFELDNAIPIDEKEYENLTEYDEINFEMRYNETCKFFKNLQCYD